eukprot:SAG22_NODE_817_length_7026_cov_13.636206_5_plen_134_part_00
MATPAQLAEFAERGFISVAVPLCPASELRALVREYDRIFASASTDSDLVERRNTGRLFDLGGPSPLGDAGVGGWTLPQVLSPGLAGLAPALVANCNAIAQSLLAAEPGWGAPSPLKDGHAILKPARVGAATAW